MKKLSANPVSVLLVLAAFAATTFLLPSSANAKWPQPPDDDGPSWGKILAVGVVLGLASYGIAYLITHKKTEKTDLPEKTEETEGTESATEDESEPSVTNEDRQSSSDFSRSLLTEQQSSRFGLYFDIDQLGEEIGLREKEIDFSDVTVKVGVSFSF